MSIMVCENCPRYVDTDFEEMIPVSIDPDVYWCTACFEAEHGFEDDLPVLSNPEKLTESLNMEVF